MKKRQKVISTRESLKYKDFTGYIFMNLSLEDIEGEEWLEIPSFDGSYLISSYGRIKALSRLIEYMIRGRQVSYYSKERIVPQSLYGTYNEHTKDYNFNLQVNLTYEKQQHSFIVSRLMYELFVEGLDFKKDKLSIVHKDGDNLNNTIENLEISSRTTIFYKTIKNDTRPRTPSLPEKFYNQIGVTQYDLQGNILHQFSSVTEAAKAMQTKVYELKKVLMNQAKQFKGFVFRYETDTYSGEYANFSKTKKVSQYTPEGILLKTFDSVVEASKEIGANIDIISKCALKKIKFASGFVWRYSGDIYSGEFTHKKRKTVVYQYDKGGSFIREFESITDAAKSVNLVSSTIFSCVSGKNKTAGGYVWRYKDQAYHGEYKGISRVLAVTQLDQSGKIIETYPSTMAASRATGIQQATIHRWVTTKKNSPSSFFWRKATQEEIQQIPINHLLPPPVRNTNSISVSQYTKEGEKIATFETISEATRVTGITNNTIIKFLNNPLNVSGKFIWRKEGDIYRGELKNSVRKNEAKTVSQYDLSGNKIAEYPSSYVARKSLNISNANINLALTGKQQSAYGFIWRYGNGPDKIEIDEEVIYPRSKTISCYDFEGNKKGYYKSMGEAARVHKHSYLGISLAVNGKSKSASELIWIYGNGPEKIDTNTYFMKGEVKSISENVTEKI